jgi:hypothetical protein
VSETQPIARVAELAPVRRALTVGQLAAAVFTLALAVGAVLRFWQLAGKPDWQYDEGVYTQVGTNVLHGVLAEHITYGTPWQPFLYQPPLYFLILARWFALTGPSIYHARILGVLCSLGTLTVLFRLMWRLRGPAAALFVSLPVIFDGWLLYIQRSSYIENFLLLLITVSVLLYQRAREVPTFGRFVTAGGMIAVTIAVKYTAAYLVLVVLLCWLISSARGEAGISDPFDATRARGEAELSDAEIMARARGEADVADRSHRSYARGEASIADEQSAVSARGEAHVADEELFPSARGEASVADSRIIMSSARGEADIADYEDLSGARGEAGIADPLLEEGARGEAEISDDDQSWSARGEASSIADSRLSINARGEAGVSDTRQIRNARGEARFSDDAHDPVTGARGEARIADNSPRSASARGEASNISDPRSLPYAHGEAKYRRQDALGHLALLGTTITVLAVYAAVMYWWFDLPQGQDWWVRQNAVQLRRVLGLQKSGGTLTSPGAALHLLFAQYRVFAPSFVVAVAAFTLGAVMLARCWRARSWARLQPDALLWSWMAAGVVVFGSSSLRFPQYFALILVPMYCYIWSAVWAAPRPVRLKLAAAGVAVVLGVGSFWLRVPAQTGNPFREVQSYAAASIPPGAVVVTEEAIGDLIRQRWCRVEQPAACTRAASYAITWKTYLQSSFTLGGAPFARMMRGAVPLRSWPGFSGTATVWRLK